MTKLIDAFENFAKAPTNEGDKDKFDVWLTVHRNSVWIRKTS